MPSQDFQHHVVIDLGRPQAWEVLMDVQTVAGWVGLIGQVEEISPLSRYRAELSERVGPFRLRADLEVNIKRVEEGSMVVLEAEGRGPAGPFPHQGQPDHASVRCR